MMKKKNIKPKKKKCKKCGNNFLDYARNNLVDKCYECYKIEIGINRRKDELF